MVNNFLFHRVNPERDPLWDPMDVRLFEKCIKFISRNFEVRQVEELLPDGNSLHSNRKFATIVFDDGYKDNIQWAAPVLEKYKIKASFYVVTDCINNNIPTWTYILDYLFRNTAIQKLDVLFDFVPVALRVKELKDEQLRVNYVKKLKPAMKKLSHENRTQLMDHFSKVFNDVALPKLMMDWDDLRQLRSYGHYIGSHTITHCMLGTMNDETEIKNELSGSGNEIKTQLGYFPKTISYPVGSYNETTIRLSKEAGYQVGLAVKQRKYDPSRDSVFEIPRIELYNEAWLKTQMRINGVYGKLSKLFN